MLRFLSTTVFLDPVTLLAQRIGIMCALLWIVFHNRNRSAHLSLQ
jgi:hypothetical protein